MNCAILQTALDLPDLEKLKRAFRSAASLTAVDAQILRKEAFGILVRDKPLTEATTLQSTLRTEGIETHVVVENELPVLPATKLVKRVNCTPEALRVYDPAGDDFPVHWEHVALIAAGRVTKSHFPKEETTRVAQYVRPRPENRFEYEYVETVTEVEYHERRKPHLMLDILLGRAAARFRIVADESAPLLFSYLGERRTNSLPQNFRLLVQDLCRFAPNAALNRGACCLRENTGELFAYPTMSAFLAEIIWLLWWMKQEGQDRGAA